MSQEPILGLVLEVSPETDMVSVWPLAGGRTMLRLKAGGNKFMMGHWVRVRGNTVRLAHGNLIKTKRVSLSGEPVISASVTVALLTDTSMLNENQKAFTQKGVVLVSPVLGVIAKPRGGDLEPGKLYKCSVVSYASKKNSKWHSVLEQLDSIWLCVKDEFEEVCNVDDLREADKSDIFKRYAVRLDMPLLPGGETTEDSEFEDLEFSDDNRDEFCQFERNVIGVPPSDDEDEEIDELPAAVLSGHAVNSGIVDDVVDDEPLDANVVSPFPGDIDEPSPFNESNGQCESFVHSYIPTEEDSNDEWGSFGRDQSPFFQQAASGQSTSHHYDYNNNNGLDSGELASGDVMLPVPLHLRSPEEICALAGYKYDEAMREMMYKYKADPFNAELDPVVKMHEASRDAALSEHSAEHNKTSKCNGVVVANVNRAAVDLNNNQAPRYDVPFEVVMALGDVLDSMQVRRAIEARYPHSLRVLDNFLHQIEESERKPSSISR